MKQEITPETAPETAPETTPETVTGTAPEKAGRKGILGALLLFLKGIVVGVANVIPGVSGGTIAVITGVFDRLIGALNTLFRKFRENMKFLIPLGLGAAAGILALSKVMGYCLTHFTLQTNFFFVGLVLGSIPLIFRKTRASGRFRPVHAVPFCAALLLVVALALVQTYAMPDSTGNQAGVLPEMNVGQFLQYFVGGLVSAAAMVVPGISGSLVMVLLGIYDKVIAAVNGITNFSDHRAMLDALLAIIPIGLGIVAGIFTVAKLIELLLRRFRTGTYYTILGLMLGSLAALLIALRLPSLSVSVAAVAVSVATCGLGFVTSFFLGRES